MRHNDLRRVVLAFTILICTVHPSKSFSESLHNKIKVTKKQFRNLHYCKESLLGQNTKQLHTPLNLGGIRIRETAMARLAIENGGEDKLLDQACTDLDLCLTDEAERTLRWACQKWYAKANKRNAG